MSELTFLKILDEKDQKLLKNAGYTQNPKFHTVTGRLEIFLENDQILPFRLYELILTRLQLELHCAIDLYVKPKDASAPLEEINQYLSWIVSKNPAYRELNFLYPFKQEDCICFSTQDEEQLERIKQLLPSLEKAFKRTGIAPNFNAVLEEIPVVPELPEIPVQPVESKQKTKSKSQPKDSNKTKDSYKKGNGNYRKKDVTLMEIADLQSGMDNVAIEGHIFEMENRVLRSGKTLQMIYVSDYKEAILCKRFEGARHSIEELNSVKNGKNYRITGRVEYEEYSKCNCLMINKIEEIPAKKRIDDAPEKRTEWHVHSNFSEMDGVCAVEEFIQTSYDWGMDSIGICDHEVVQAFPMAQHKVTALNKLDPDRQFKMLYGCEMSMVDDHYYIVENAKDIPLEEATFVCFDLETTGLSQRLDEIIEFGAVKMQYRDIVETKQFFVKPKRLIPAHISNLTHINQSDVDKARSIEECMNEILEFFGDSILVAHNATFDIGFINAALERMGRPRLKNPVIDTLPMAHAMLQLSRYNLGAVCRAMDVEYDGEGAHRADYDARVLSLAFCHLLNKLGSGVSLKKLEQMDDSTSIKKKKPSHVTVYAKNKQGLKELFELITLSHTKYLATSGKANASGQPRIPKRILKEYHDKGNLLFGSSCQNGEVFDLAHTRSERELLEAMDFYDYMEVQPLDCYSNLIDRGAILDKQDLMSICRFILEAAEMKHKPVLATSDAHYVHPYEKRVRDIYINTPRIGGVRHPLYTFKMAERLAHEPPKQHLLTTNEMLDSFKWLGDKKAREIVLENPNKLKQLTEPLYPVKSKLYPPDIEGCDQKLRDICYETAHDVYGDKLPDIVFNRLEHELDSIIGHGYYVVYYISHLLVKKSNADGYMVGSRGSVGSSFVATMSGITEVNPLKPHYICKKCHHQEWIEDGEAKSGFDLPDKECPVCHSIMRGDGQDIPFETFLGFEGDKVPDIDLNFSGDYQANAHAYTKDVFGEDHVFRAGTVGTVKDKTAFGYISNYEEETGHMDDPFSEAKRKDLAKCCEGVKRTTGQHPGGIVVVPLDMDVHDFTPVQYPANNPDAEWKTTHFDFHQIHDNILKFDILGHVDPTAMKMFERISGLDVTKIPMNDPDTMSIFSSTDALKIDSTKLYTQTTGAAGIPEFGTPFVRGILELTKPTTFAELVSISGLSHGTDVWLNNAKDLIENGTCKLSEVIGCRDDIMIDLLSYGLPPKDSFTIMESVRKGKGLKPEWEDEMREHNVPEWFIDSCKKIKYMFPKAHAVAYVMNAVRIAWFKVHMPLHYYCQYFSIRCDSYDLETMIHGETAIRKKMEEIEGKKSRGEKVEAKEQAIYDSLELALEMVLRGYHFSNVSINRSAACEFILDPDDPQAIIPPFSALDGLGENVAQSIVAAREDKTFLSKEDILKRTQISSTHLDKLSAMGATDGLDETNQISLF